MMAWKLLSRRTGNIGDKGIKSAMVEYDSWVGLKNKTVKTMQRNSVSEEQQRPHKTWA